MSDFSDFLKPNRQKALAASSTVLAPGQTTTPAPTTQPETPRWLQGLDALDTGRGHRPPRGRHMRGARPPRGARVGRVRRVALIVALGLAIPALASFGSMLARPSDSSLSIRTVEW